MVMSDMNGRFWGCRKGKEKLVHAKAAKIAKRQFFDIRAAYSTVRFELSFE